MISQKPITKQTQKGGTMYKLNYKEHIILKQAAFIIMQNHNQKQYQNHTKQFINYNQTIQQLYKKSKTELLNIIDRYQTSQEKQTNNKLLEHNQSQIIIPKLNDITDQQLELITTKLQQLEQIYYLDIDTDYTNKQSILITYQQILAYKHYNIEIPKKQNQEILIGNTEILDTIQ